MSDRNLFSLTEDDRRHADAQIKDKQQEVKYDLRDFTIDYIVQQFREDLFYVPEYQRKNIWHTRHKCRFIESVLLGLPIPMMFVADMDDGRLEIVDGAQRIHTLEEFLNNDLRLQKLEHLATLNDFTFKELSLPQQRKLRTRALRIVVLEDSTTPDTRQEIFDRVNTSGDRVRPAEVRRGAYEGPFMRFVRDCAQDEQFCRLCPISKALRDRREDEELTLRFFAYSDWYKQFRHDVNRFLDKFVQDHKNDFDKDRMTLEFRRMLDFVERHFPIGFSKTANAKTTPRVRFEAISVGVNLALREDPDIVPASPRKWLDSEEFRRHTTTHASNSRPRLRDRIEFVRDNLLGKAD